jgi:tetratricopeptide (TPR) repeat protein
MIPGDTFTIPSKKRDFSSVLKEKILSSPSNFTLQMADLKEETTVENQQVDTAAPRKTIDPSVEGLQLFYEKNKNMVNYVGGGLLVIIAGFLYYKLSYLPEKEAEAANEIFWAQNYFEKDSFNVALRGGAMVFSPDGQKQMLGFEQIADEYSMTSSGNIANFYAGICYLRTGQFEQAIEFLRKYDSNDEIGAPLALGAIGDASMELNRYDEAVKYYLKAADKSKNPFTAPYFLKKAGLAHELNTDLKGALEAYERLLREFPNSEHGREVEKDIARIKALGNL